jgi:amidase
VSNLGDNGVDQQGEGLSFDDPHEQSAGVANLTASELAAAFERGELRSVEVAETLIGRIEALDASGMELHSVLEIAPDALEQAASLDAERQAGRIRGPLHGIPVLLKDNIDTVAPLHTTAGSTIFGTNSPGRDAPLVEVLRAAGALVLGKTNLSEWANFRGRPSSSGWSAAGGQTRNPHALDRTPGGSSAGSGAGVAARLSPMAVGTETDGSVLCPSAANGIAGLKPTVGLVSRTGIVPISSSQDTAGPMARSVEDLALLLEAMSRAVDDGEDPAALVSRRPKGLKTHYCSLLGDGSLEGVRVGVPRQSSFFDYHPPTDRAFEAVIEALKETGAEVVDSLKAPSDPLVSGKDEMLVMAHEFAVGLEQYFARRAATPTDPSELPGTIEDLLEHIASDPAERLDVFGCELIERAAATKKQDASEYKRAVAENKARARKGLDGFFSGDEGVDLLAVPAMPPAWLIDHVVGDQVPGSGWSPSAVAGYPSATLPYGRIGGLPVGVALLGPAWSEASLLRAMFALERCLGPALSRPVPAFAESVSLRAAFSGPASPL